MVRVLDAIMFLALGLAVYFLVWKNPKFQSFINQTGTGGDTTTTTDGGNGTGTGTTPTTVPSGTNTSLVFPAGVVQGAMVDENCHEDGNGQLVSAFNALVKKPIGVCFFTDNWYSGINFPASKCQSIKAAGAVPFIRMQTWQKEGDTLADLGPYTHKNITAGQHDAALKAYAQAAKSFGSLVLIQYGVEVNGNWFPWSKEGPAAYVAACKHVIDLFRNAGANNVKWGFQVDATDNANGSQWYPGDSYIDIIGTSCYGAAGYGQQGMASELAKCWGSFSSISSSKPLGIFEWGQALASDNTSALNTIANNTTYSRIKLMMYWNEKLCDPADPIPPDGRVNANQQSLTAYQQGISNPRFTSTPPSLAGASTSAASAYQIAKAHMASLPVQRINVSMHR